MSNICRILQGSKYNSWKTIIDDISLDYPAVLDKFSREFIADEAQITKTDTDFVEFLNKLAAKVNITAITVPTDKTKIGVEQVQEILNFAQLRPHLSKRAFIVIISSEYLSLDAQGQLLKLLEEPPLFLQLFLTVNNADKLLATIRSRSEIIVSGDSLATSELTSENLSQLSKILNLLIGDKQERKEGYFQFKTLIDKLKVNSQKQALLNDFTKIVNSQLLAEQSPFANIEKKNQASKIINTVFEANKANTNPKLLVDFIYNEFRLI